MNKKITEAFAKGKAFIPFVTCGDPSLNVTEKIVYAMEEAGADLIDFGIPFFFLFVEGQQKDLLSRVQTCVLCPVELPQIKSLIW